MIGSLRFFARFAPLFERLPPQTRFAPPLTACAHAMDRS
jgi:hypothetical protein